MALSEIEMRQVVNCIMDTCEQYYQSCRYAMAALMKTFPQYAIAIKEQYESRSGHNL
jgi:hypothetical protein